MRIANNDAPKLARSTLIHVNAGETVSGYVVGVSSATTQGWAQAAYETKLEQAFGSSLLHVAVKLSARICFGGLVCALTSERPRSRS